MINESKHITCKAKFHVDWVWKFGDWLQSNIVMPLCHLYSILYRVCFRVQCLEASVVGLSLALRSSTSAKLSIFLRQCVTVAKTKRQEITLICQGQSFFFHRTKQRGSVSKLDWSEKELLGPELVVEFPFKFVWQVKEKLANLVMFDKAQLVTMVEWCRWCKFFWEATHVAPQQEQLQVGKVTTHEDYFNNNYYCNCSSYN